MSDFDPADELDTQAQADAYVNWCAEQFIRISTGGVYTYRTATRASAWLFVVSTAQLHLDDEVEHNREDMLHQLTANQHVARMMERQRQKLPVERLIIMRGALDCWEPVGRFSNSLLTAAKCALAARILIEMHPLVDLWSVQCLDVWTLLGCGQYQLQAINAALEFGGEGQLEVEDYAVRANEDVAAKFTWQQLHNWSRHHGIPPFSAN